MAKDHIEHQGPEIAATFVDGPLAGATTSVFSSHRSMFGRLDIHDDGTATTRKCVYELRGDQLFLVDHGLKGKLSEDGWRVQRGIPYHRSS